MWFALFLISMTWLFSLHIYTSENYLAVAILTVFAVISASIPFLKTPLDFTSFNRKYYILLLPLAISCLLLPFPYNMGIALLFIGLSIIPLHSQKTGKETPAEELGIQNAEFERERIEKPVCVQGTGRLRKTRKFLSRLSRNFVSFVVQLPKSEFRSALSASLLFNGAILIFQSLNPYFYAVFVSSSHQFDILTPIVYRIMEFLRLPVSYSQNTLFVQMMRELHAFPTTWEKIGILPFLNLMVGGALFFWLFPPFKGLRKKIFSFSSFLIIGAIYLLVRYIFMILIFVYMMYFVGYYEETSMIYIFWSPISILLSFLPFPFLISKVLPLRLTAEDISNKFSQPLNKRDIAATIFLCIGVFFVVSSIFFRDPGREKIGRALIDEKHSKWEISTKKYDTNWYGPESGYNYYCMAEYLNHHYRLDRNFDEITDELLSKYDVLILKIPTSPFSDEEIKAIVQFVKDGGGLFLLGEHTNVFGSSAFLNPIANRFNFSFRYDVIFDIEKKFVQLYVPPKFLPHPIVQNMPPFLFETSCSIEPYSYFVDRVILENGLKSLDIDYHSSNFYPQVKDASNMNFGPFIQMLAVKEGKGRVAAFTDSTVFSNFSAFNPGKPELLLGAVNWLNKTNHLGWLNYLFLLMAIASFASAVIMFRKDSLLSKLLSRGQFQSNLEKAKPLGAHEDATMNYRFISLFIISIIFVISIAIPLFTAATRRSYPLPKPHTPPIKIYFEKEHSNYQFPLVGHVDDYEKSYEIFYQWVLRLGYFPFIGNNLNDCIERGNMVVIINPQRDFTLKEIAAAKEYISKGGKILLMDNPSNVGSSANSLLQAFGLKINSGNQIKPNIIREADNKNSWAIGYIDANPIQGGKALLFTDGGEAILSMAKEGKGTVVAMTFSSRFVDTQMGGIERVVPDEKLLRIFNLEFALFRGIINDNLEEEISRLFK